MKRPNLHLPSINAPKRHVLFIIAVVVAVAVILSLSIASYQKHQEQVKASQAEAQAAAVVRENERAVLVHDNAVLKQSLAGANAVKAEVCTSYKQAAAKSPRTVIVPKACL